MSLNLEKKYINLWKFEKWLNGTPDPSDFAEVSIFLTKTQKFNKFEQY